MESFLTTIGDICRDENLPALMIGGHAVTALGHPRATYDLDLLIPRSSADEWKRVLNHLKYRSFAESSNFHQYEASADLPLPPLDLMLVDDEVFHALEATKVDSKPIGTPSVIAMIALKLHAIHQPDRDDVEKDWSDIMALVRVHRLTLDDPDFAAMVGKHGGESAVKRIRETIGGRD